MLFQIALAAVIVFVLVLSVLKWRANAENAELFETRWKESDRERANLEVRIADTENERLNLAAGFKDLQAQMRIRELENNRLDADIGKLTDKNVRLKKELTELRELAHAPATVRLQRIMDHSPYYDASTRKELRGLAAKLMRV